MDTYYFYIVRCIDGTFYCGITTDLERRVEEHNLDPAKGAKYTRGRTPVRLVYYEEYSSRSEASKREYEVKQWTKEQKQKLISQT